MSEIREIEEHESGYRKCFLTVNAVTDPPEVRDSLDHDNWERALKEATDYIWSQAIGGGQEQNGEPWGVMPGIRITEVKSPRCVRYWKARNYYLRDHRS